MATDALSLQMLDLPDDILLEILVLLPVISVVMHCRRVCHKMNTLSREQYLWIRLFNRTKYMLRRPIELEQFGTPEFEKSMCQAEMLKRIWSDESTLATAPRFWCGSQVHRPIYHGAAVAIMGDYIIFWHVRAYNKPQHFTWISARDWNGPVVLRFEVPLGFFNTRYFMDLDTGIFYLTSPSDIGLDIKGFQVDPQVGHPREVIQYSLPTRRRDFHPPGGMATGFLCLDYGVSDDDLNFDVDVVDLRRGILFQLVLPHLASLFPEDREFLIHGQRTIAVADTHLICGIDGSLLTNATAFAVFRLPASNQGIQLGNGATLPARMAPHLNPILIGKLPFYLERWWTMPRSATSFVMVGVCQLSSYGLGESTMIQMFSFNVAEEKPSFKEVGSIAVQGRFSNCILRSPPSTTRYVLGILAVTQVVRDGSPSFKWPNFALRIELPDPDQDPESGNRCEMAVTRIQLAPAINEEERAEVQCFDHFSGRVVVLLPLGFRTGVVFDYLSGRM